MKKQLYHIQMIVLILGTGLLSSCNDFFNLDPENGIKNNKFYTNRNDLNAASYGIYAALTPEVHKFLLWGSARADMVTAGEGSDVYVNEFINNNVTDLNPYTDYSGLYKAISRCNHQLENIDRVEIKDESLGKDDLDAFRGEAYYMRALCYFYLVRTYKEFPLITSDISNTVLYVNADGDTIRSKTLDLSDEDLRAVALQPKAEEEVWKLIMSDVNKAMGLMKLDYNWVYFNSLTTNERYGRASLPAAFALGCEVAMWLKQYQKASSYADLVINNSYHDIGAASSWSSQFTGNGLVSPYALFLLGYRYDQSFETNRLQEFTSNEESDGGRYLLKPMMLVVDSVFSESADVRRNSFRRVNRKDLIWKYIGTDVNSDAMRAAYRSDASWHMTKSADIYLWKGIAENRLGNASAALYFLNKVRVNRGLDEYEKDKISMRMEDLEDMLFLERAREMAFEGKRWYDLLYMEKILEREGKLASAVSRKYPLSQRDAMYDYLKDETHWYLPVDPTRWK